jgi:hypothetical protein
MAQDRWDIEDWNDQLNLGLERFWAGDLTASGIIFQRILLILLPAVNRIAQEREVLPATHRRQTVADVTKIYFIHTFAGLGWWAVRYTRGDERLGHPALPDIFAADPELWGFVVDVHLALIDLSPVALKCYEEYLIQVGDGPRAVQIAELMRSASYSSNGLRVLHKLYDLYPHQRLIARHLCAWLLQAGALEEANQIALSLYMRKNTDPFAVDCMAYITEKLGNWRSSYNHHAARGRWLRAALVAAMADMQPEVVQCMEKVPENRPDNPVWAFCSGWLNYKGGHTSDAIEIWLKGVLYKAGNPEHAEILKTLRKMETSPIEVTAKLLANFGHLFSSLMCDVLRWFLYQRDSLPDSQNPQAIQERLKKQIESVKRADLSTKHHPVLDAVASSVILSLIQSEGNLRLSYLQFLPEEIEQQVRALERAKNRQWMQAIELIGESGDIKLIEKILKYALVDLLQEQRWQEISSLIAIWRQISDDKKCMPRQFNGRLLRGLSEINAYSSLLQELNRLIVTIPDAGNAEGESATPSDDEAYFLMQCQHNASLIYTKRALQTDSDRDWLHAIGHWAVVMSDDDYWIEWYSRRKSRYGNTAESVDLQSVKAQVTQQVVQIFEHLPNSADKSKQHDRHERLNVLWQWERVAVSAVQYVLRNAAHQKAVVPQVVERLLSPTLLRELGYQKEITEFLAIAKRLKLSRYEVELLEKAFSCESEAEALIDSGNYRLAISTLTATPNPSPRAQELLELSYQYLIEDMLVRSAFDDALDVALTLHETAADKSDVDDILVSTAKGWGEHAALSGASYESIVDHLSEIKSRLRSQRSELDSLLSRIYLQRRMHQGVTNNPAHSFFPAFSLDKNSSKVQVKAHLASVYREEAKNHLQSGTMEDALELAELSMSHAPSPETAQLLVTITSALVQQNFEEEDIERARSMISLMVNYSQQGADLRDYSSRVLLLVDDLLDSGREHLAMLILVEVVKAPYAEDIVPAHDLISRLAVG